MNEQKFEELLLKNNEYLLEQMDQKIDKALIKNNEKLKEDLTGIITKRVTTKIMFEVKKEIEKSEERQNSKLAYLEYTYGEKISAIFDKIQSMEEIMIRAEREHRRYRKIVDRHSEILYSHDLRISDIERKFDSN